MLILSHVLCLLYVIVPVMSVMKNQLEIFAFAIRFSVHGDQFELPGEISCRRKDLVT